jgi:dihydrodipicolinate synthase/N-acetylneuraminate lyase
MADPSYCPLAVPTAFHADGTLDLDGQAVLAAAVAAAGADALSVLDPVAGEVDHLDDDERDAVVRAARRGGAGLALLAGVGTGPSPLLAGRRALAAGADGLVVPRTASIARHGDALEQLAALGAPLHLQHHPGATGTVHTAGELASLATEVEAAAVLQEAVPVPDRVADLVAAQVRVLGGLAGLFLPEELDAGAAGTAAASAVPERLTLVVTRHRAGDAHAAREVHLEAAGYLRLEAGSSGTLVRKEAWRQRGMLGSARVRRGSPLGPTTKAALTRRLSELGVELSDPWPGA